MVVAPANKKAAGRPAAGPELTGPAITSKDLASAPLNLYKELSIEELKQVKHNAGKILRKKIKTASKHRSADKDGKKSAVASKDADAQNIVHDDGDADAIFADESDSSWDNGEEFFRRAQEYFNKHYFHARGGKGRGHRGSRKHSNGMHKMGGRGGRHFGGPSPYGFAGSPGFDSFPSPPPPHPHHYGHHGPRDAPPHMRGYGTPEFGSRDEDPFHCFGPPRDKHSGSCSFFARGGAPPPPFPPPPGPPPHHYYHACAHSSRHHRPPHPPVGPADSSVFGFDYPPHFGPFGHRGGKGRGCHSSRFFPHRGEEFGYERGPSFGPFGSSAAYETFGPDVFKSNDDSSSSSSSEVGSLSESDSESNSEKSFDGEKFVTVPTGKY